MQEGYGAEAIGRRIRSGLADMGITSDELADKIGVSRFTVSSWLSGRTRMKLADAIAVCDVFGWPLDRLARREGGTPAGRA